MDRKNVGLHFYIRKLQMRDHSYLLWSRSFLLIQNIYDNISSKKTEKNGKSQHIELRSESRNINTLHVIFLH